MITRIISFNFIPPPEAQLLVEQPEFTFHLGGSHYFGVATEQSDFDFITQDSDGVVKWLESVGFKQMGKPLTDAARLLQDVTLASEYEAPDTRGIWQLGRVQVQVVYDLRAVLAARTILAIHFNHEHAAMNKEARDKVWPAMISVVQLIYSFDKAD